MSQFLLTHLLVLLNLVSLRRVKEFASASELDMSITTKVEHYNSDESEEPFVQESCDDMVKVGPTNLEFDVVEYESFSGRSDEIESLDMGFCIEYESFFFDPITTYHLF